MWGDWFLVIDNTDNIISIIYIITGLDHTDNYTEANNRMDIQDEYLIIHHTSSFVSDLTPCGLLSVRIISRIYIVMNELFNKLL